jgi:Mn2+/Fe2+ NRAMP family transporter
VWVVLLGGSLAWTTIQLRYATIARVLKWLALVLFAYVITGIHIRPPWTAVLGATFVPSMPSSRGGWATLVAILGTTISPYLFFWQASQEVEEEKAIGRHTVGERRGASAAELLDRKIDVGVGTFFSNLVMYFIILTTAFTLHVHGLTELSTSRQVAEALRPLAGNFATLLYTIGIVGTGLLAIPTLSGSAAYYMVVGTAMAAGVAMDFANVNPVKGLYWTAIINGLLAPFLLTGILLVASDRKLMRNQPSSRLGRITVGITTALMFAAAVAMFVV